MWPSTILLKNTSWLINCLQKKRKHSPEFSNLDVLIVLFCPLLENACFYVTLCTARQEELQRQQHRGAAKQRPSRRQRRGTGAKACPIPSSCAASKSFQDLRYLKTFRLQSSRSTARESANARAMEEQDRQLEEIAREQERRKSVSAEANAEEENGRRRQR